MLGDHLRGGARDVAEVMEPPRRVAEILSGERGAHDVRSAAGKRARGEQPSKGRALAVQRALQPRAAPLEQRNLLAARARLRLERAQRAAGVGDRALRIAQRVARFAPVRLAAFQLAAQRLDPRAQCREILFLGRVRRRRQRENEEEKDRSQALALPCAATAARRFSTSAASPR
jgi:hypothetical protein